VRVVTDETGHKLDETKLFPYREEIPIGASGASDNSHRFTGHERDGESGQDYMRARYFTSTAGRFISIDPLPGHLVQPQSLNRYLYTANNPIRYTDPTGLDFTIKCGKKDNSETCKDGKKGKWNHDKEGKRTTFDPTVISSSPGDGTLRDQDGHKYSGEVRADGLHLNGGSKDLPLGIGEWNDDPGASQDPVEVNQQTGHLAGLSYTFVKPGPGESAWGGWAYSGTVEQARTSLFSEGFVQTYRFPHVGKMEAFKSPGDPDGRNRVHLFINKGSADGNVMGDLHTGELVPGRHFYQHMIDALGDLVIGHGELPQ